MSEFVFVHGRLCLLCDVVWQQKKKASPSAAGPLYTLVAKWFGGLVAWWLGGLVAWWLGGSGDGGGRAGEEVGEGTG